MFQYMQYSSSVTLASATANINANITANELRLGEVIGSGRHGVVLRADRTNLNPLDVLDLTDSSDPVGLGDSGAVAVKVPNNGQSLETEAEVLRRFEHPHIVKLLGGPLDNGALVLEYCNRGSLAGRGDEPLTSAEAATVLHQIGSALTELHANGWIHGDVSMNNIVIRNDGTLALIDFATARRADGGPLTEGTAELAGPRRTARSELDLRCLAAAVLAALPDPTFDAKVPLDIRTQRQALLSVIERSDAGQSVNLSDLVVNAAAEDVEIAVKQRVAAWRPKGPTTREFGPRPGGGGSQPGEASNAQNRLKVVVAVALLGALALTSSLFERTASVATTSAQTAARHEAVQQHANDQDHANGQQQTASASLAAVDVVWRDGLAVRNTANGPITYEIGRPGDLAAVGDWDCNGTATLGVYRPDTGAWFTFDSWTSRAQSTVHEVEPGHTELLVMHSSTGCAAPELR